MNISQTRIHGVFEIDLALIEDDRGFFARTYCREEFASQGITFSPLQANVSFNKHTGTLRGMHFQTQPHGESKLVSCRRGRVFDVAVDLRHGSPTFRQWVGRELSEANNKSLFIPEGCAHGFITLDNNSEVSYLMGAMYAPEHTAGVRWNDPAFAIDWPITPRIISERDADYADFPAA